MKLKQKKTEANFKNLLMFSFIFFFLVFTLSYVSSSTWINYGSDSVSITNAQFPNFKSNLYSGIERLNSSYGQSYENDDENQPLISSLNNEQFIAVQDGLYLRLLGEDLSLNSELLLSNNPVGQMAITDFNDDGRKDIVRATRYNDTAINISVFNIASNWDLTLQTSLLYTADGRNIDITGFRCLEENPTACYSGLSLTNDSECDLYIMDVYENTGNINVAVYNLENNASDCDFYSQVDIQDIDDNSPLRNEFMIYTKDKLYVRDSNTKKFNISFSSAYPYDFIKQAGFINTADGYKVFVLRSRYDNSDSSIGSIMYLYNNDGNTYLTNTAKLDDRMTLEGLAIADYTGNGYDDIFTLEGSFGGVGSETYYPTIYRGNDLTTLEQGSFDFNLENQPNGRNNRLGYLTIGKLNNSDDWFYLVSSRLNNAIEIYDLNNDSLLYTSNEMDSKCIPADVSGSNLNDVFCINSDDSFLLTSQIDTLEGYPNQITSFPDVNMNTNSGKDYNLNNYFEDYETINLTALNETISVNLDDGGSTDSLSNVNVTISLLDFGEYIRLTINSKDNEYNLNNIELKAINIAGSITDTFDLSIIEDYEEEIETDNALTNTAESVLGIFPDADSLSSSQKIMIVFLVLFGIGLIMILGMVSANGELTTGGLYLTALMEFLGFILLIGLGYIGVGILIVVALLLIAISYFKFFKGKD